MGKWLPGEKGFLRELLHKVRISSKGMVMGPSEGREGEQYENEEL